MNYRREAQFTNNASKRVFEEVYTNEDMEDTRAFNNNGVYSLRVPEMFASNVSQEKAISPRRVMCEPKSHTFWVQVVYYDSEDTKLTESDVEFYDFTSNNTMEEILHRLTTDAASIDENSKTYNLIYLYNKEIGKLDFRALCSDSSPIKFSFSCPSYNDYFHLWRLFNQIGYPFNAQLEINQYVQEVLPPTEELSLNNVWSREPLYVHATISSSKKHYLCRTGDFWFKPSKYYYDNITNDLFDIYFTTDGTNKIIPYDAIKVIELCFILRQFARL